MNSCDHIRLAHANCKVKVRVFMQGTGAEQLDAEEIARDDLCELGQWILEQGVETFSKVSEFSALKQAHTDFHNCAAKIVQCVRDGQQEEAENLLASNSDYAMLSKLINDNLKKLHAIKKSKGKHRIEDTKKQKKKNKQKKEKQKRKGKSVKDKNK